jgi:hypothetical protein
MLMTERKRLMRKRKAELLALLAERGRRAAPETLKRDLVDMLVAGRRQTNAGTAAPHGTRESSRQAPETARSAGQDESATAMHTGHGADPYDTEPPRLPRAYGEDRVVAMVRDPHWLFAYWELTPESVDRTRLRLGEDAEHARLVLRVYDTTGFTFTGRNAHRHFDIDVGDADNWYIETGYPEKSYCLEIGLLGPQGEFLPIARSNTVDTPRDDISEDVHEYWMSLEAGIERIHPTSAFPESERAEELRELAEKQSRAHAERETSGSLFSMTTQRE